MLINEHVIWLQTKLKVKKGLPKADPKHIQT